jgi:hypothetical protein
MRFKRFIPRRVKRWISNTLLKDRAARQKFLWGEDEMVEFWLDGFNDDMTVAFLHLVELYNQILHKDPQWHYFYEDHYSLVRCSMKYRDVVRKFFDDRNIKYKWPASGWSETLYTTNMYKEEFKHLFHNFSVLTIKMHNGGDGTNYLREAADRVCHCFFNHATYLAHRSGLTKSYDEAGYPADYWEAKYMADLAASRAYHIGRCKQQKSVKEYFSDATGLTGEADEIFMEMVKLVKAAESVLLENNKESEESDESNENISSKS